VIKVTENQGPLYVSSITCSSSGDDTQTAVGTLRACYVSRLIRAIKCSELFKLKCSLAAIFNNFTPVYNNVRYFTQICYFKILKNYFLLPPTPEPK
jgi:hypothetical protein